MKGLKFLLLSVAICLTNEVKAQFYDSADDIYFYYCDEEGMSSHHRVYIFNFDGKNATWWICAVSDVKNKLKENPYYYEEATETADYSIIKFVSSSSIETKYIFGNNQFLYTFSKDRNTMVETTIAYDTKRTYKRVDKSFFKVGRSRTPSGTMHE